MYNSPGAQQSAGATIAKTSLPVIAAICCGATLLLLLASTIILALIPIYIPQKTLTKASTTTSLASSYVPLATNTGRKRDSNDKIEDANGGILADQSLSDVKSKHLIILKKSKLVDDITGLSCTIVQLSSRRRRLAITKRQSSGQTYLKCQYYVVLISTLTVPSQQTAAAVYIQQVFANDASVLSIFVFDNLLIVINGQTKGFRCKANGRGFMSSFGHGGSKFSDDKKTIPPTSATTSPGIMG